MKILLVEDHQDLANSLRQSLKAECFEVDCVHTGKEGVYYARTNPYDLVVLDLHLPDTDGINVCKKMRSNGLSAPIIFLSGDAEKENIINGLNAGGDDYITKPFSFSELLARIRAILRRPQHIESEVFSVDNLIVNTTTQRVTRGKDEVSLTRKEYMLLEFLIKNMGRVVSRSEIMEHVWDINADPFSNTIETHMLNLRKKVDFPPHAKLIHTLKGRGYTIEARS